MAEQEVHSSTQATCETHDRLSLQANHASCLLQVCADTLIGSDQVRGVSGGQRKRVTTGPAHPMHHGKGQNMHRKQHVMHVMLFTSEAHQKQKLVDMICLPACLLLKNVSTSKAVFCCCLR